MTDTWRQNPVARFRQQGLPVAILLLALLLAWYGAAWALNAPGAIERVLPQDGAWTWRDLLEATMVMQRPLLPAPHQVALDLWSSLLDWPLDSPRNLLYHVAVTAESTLWGFVMGTLLGLLLSVCIVHSRTLDRALLPWIVASQTVPVLAIAPIVLVILGSLGFAGVAPKAVIAMYLCFFPVTVAMVQGLRSPQRIETEMLHTYAASRWQALWLLRLPAALPFLFPALRVGIAAGLVGAMVAELPTGAQAGLGARLLTGSYYGNTVQIWSALVMSALLGLTLTSVVAGVERVVLRHRSQA
ncbi:MAG: ABC transporter permease [Rhodoferax sp.]|uniref:ABC transporter permease n=1 Tax=Rhodoferax sp. TaxID=50421 RepID=UPI00262AA711|nr:ABC transporter permease [Rhodoferax sp.]MDD5334780.1 ABC transporter permease [Rhodoferax sp.]